MAHLEGLQDALFTATTPAVAPKLDFTPLSSWPGARAFLAKLDIANATLEVALDKCQARGYFKHLKKEDWPAQLTQMGAVGLENLEVYDALIETGLIK